MTGLQLGILLIMKLFERGLLRCWGDVAKLFFAKRLRSHSHMNLPCKIFCCVPCWAPSPAVSRKYGHSRGQMFRCSSSLINTGVYSTLPALSCDLICFLLPTTDICSISSIFLESLKVGRLPFFMYDSYLILRFFLFYFLKLWNIFPFSHYY